MTAPHGMAAEVRSVRIEDELARRGVTLRGRGSERCGPCPQCGGDDRFSVNVKDQVFNCRGCGAKGHGAIDLVVFLDGSDFKGALETLAGEPRQAAAKMVAAAASAPAPKKVLVARFDYCDENGDLLFQVERVEYQNPDGSFVLKDGKRKKDFPQRRPDPDRPGHWIYKLPADIKRVLYRLPEVLEAKAHGRTIVIVEGEAKADLLWSWNIPATCNSGGAQKWKAEHSAYLRGADVAILPDNDQRGRLHLDAVAVSLKEVGATVRVLDLPGLDPKGDVINWQRAGGTREQLDDLIEREARPWAPIERLEVSSEAFARNGAAYREQKPLPPPPDRASLTVSAWLDKDIPERDFLLGGVMCTTSRWFIFGETGIGKTLIAMEMAAAVAVAAAFLKWPGQRRARVMYLDGELPMETFKERMQLIADRHGKDIEFYGYNREDLGDDGLPPLNTEPGQAWLKREIAAIKPDLIVFDSIMCLLIGSMSEEATWMPVRPFVRWLSAQRIAQVWLHHANDIGKSFGDKTREWEMEAVIKLSKVEGDETAILFEFVKARLRTPKTAAQFLPIVIHPGDWGFEGAIKSVGKRNEAQAVADAFLNALDRLADGITKARGFDGKPVSKVKVDDIRDELKKRGFLEKNETGGLTDTGRSHFRRAKTLLLSAGKILENEDLIWRK